MRSVQVAIDKRVDAYVFTGDLCDPDNGAGTIRAISLAVSMAMALARMSIPSYWLAGNHDVVEDGSGLTTLAPLRALHSDYVHVLDKPGVHYLSSHQCLLALPFTASSHGYDVVEFVLDAMEKHPAWDMIILSHLALPGIMPGSETNDMPRGREVRLPLDLAKRAKLTLNGHYHRRQVYEGVQVVGSLARLSFAEESHEPGFLVVTL